jgi:DNA replication protein DnaC
VLPVLIQKLDRYGVLVIDDISRLRRSELETSGLCSIRLRFAAQMICHRYERHSPQATSNQPFLEWDETSRAAP